MKTTIFTIVILITMQYLATAQIGLNIKKVSLFKNATCLISKEGQLKQKNGKFILPVPTTALYGTFWIGSAKENQLKGVVIKTDTLKNESKAKTVVQFIKANKGKEATIILTASDKNEKSITGKILDYYNESGLLKIKDNNDKITILPISRVDYATFSQDNNSFVNDSTARTAQLYFEKNNDNVQLQEYYLEQGMNWIPSYFLKITNDKEARLEMKATIENFAEDINDVETEVVVGSPQLYFGQMLDPVSYSYTSQSAGTGSYNYNRNDNYMLSNSAPAVQSMGGYAESNNLPGYFENNYSTEGEKNNDLYYYNLGKITLPKNAKGIFPIFASVISYKDVYKADIIDKISFATTLNCNNDENLCEVFHSIELKNSTNFPFTTAPIMVLTEKGQFMAQDQLKYTPTGAVSTIKLSKAIDIIMKNSEEELSRVENYKKIGKTTYHKVILKGTITIENLQPKQVAIDIIKHVNGNYTNNGNGKVKKQKTYNSVNPYSDLNWQINLNAGEKKTLNYEYEVLFAPYPY